MTQYVVRRAREHKQYRRVVRETGLGEDVYEWLCKLAQGAIPNPGSNRIEILYPYYKALDQRKRSVA